MTDQTVRQEILDGVLLLTIDRPRVLNAIDHQVAHEIATALTAADADDDVGAVCLTGTGTRSFSAGADLRLLDIPDATPPLGPDGTGFAGITQHPISKPVIAAVNGLARGGGIEVLLACDLAIASREATFGLPEVTRGLVATAGGCIRLPRQIPPRFAMYMLLTGEAVDAETALRWGLVNEVVDPELVLPRALELAGRVAALPREAVRAARELVRDVGWDAPPAVWQRNEEWLRKTLRSDAARDAVATFLRG